MSKTAILAADIGGTFTDVVLETPGGLTSTKVLTTHAAPEGAILTGMAQVCARAGVTAHQIARVIHGTTLATNALIERRGARTAFVTTQGFRDVIEMRTESRFEQYELNLTLPTPLIARNARFTLPERVAADGSVLIALSDQAIADLLPSLTGFASIAVGFLHAYANPTHERMVGAALALALPGVAVSLSSDVSPQMREYERFTTTCANAYVQPLMASYLLRLRDRLAAQGADCPVFVIHSGGGIMALEDAARLPVRLVESGPAGGAIFAADLARRHGLDRVLSFDMGGTTAKICLVRDFAPKTARVFEVARSWRFKKGSGMPMSIPVIDMVEIGAGGGSIAHLDALGRIAVGPESAGSEPGPAAYGRGGLRSTVTDADLTLGRLDPADFAGGAIALDTRAAATALARDVGTALDLTPLAAAAGVAEMVDETMANAARVHAVENGEDLAGYTMIAFGGAAPLHAGRLCEKLGLSRLIVPQGAGVGSAIGFLRAPFAFEATRSAYMRLDAFDASAAAAILAALQAEATDFVRACDPAAPITASARLYMRYVGQGWEIAVPVAMVAPQADSLLAAFEAEYAQLFARTVAGAAVEITVWSVQATTPLPASPPVAPPGPGAAITPGRRALYDRTTGALTPAATLPRAHLTDGTRLPGPAILTEAETTIIIPAGFTATGRADGAIDITRQP